MSMPPKDDITLNEVTFDELESVDQYEATFTGTLDDEALTLTYALESAIGAEDEAPVYTPGDDELEDVIVQPDTYEFGTDERDEVRFTATDNEENDLLLVYALSKAEDSDANVVDLDVSPET